MEPIGWRVALALSLVGGLLAALSAASAGSPPAPTGAHQPGPAPSRAQLVLSRLTDFERFKSLFGKHYGSLVEELARKKLFLARAFRAFVSAINYKSHRSDYYLSLNEMSDWTPQEVEGNFLKPEVRSDILKEALAGRQSLLDELDGAHQPSVAELGELAKAESAEPEVPVPLPSLDDIDAKLAQMAQKYRNRCQPNKDNCGAQQQRRRRRSVTSGQSNSSRGPPLPAADLVLKEEAQIEEERLRPRTATKRGRLPASNNPSYEPPEVDSFAPARGPTSAELGRAFKVDEAEANSLISSLPGGQHIMGALEGLQRMFLDYIGYDFGLEEAELERDAAGNRLTKDYRLSGCFVEPKNQGSCGSCYLFSTMALYEFVYCMNHGHAGRPVAFSEQYPLDCGGRIGMRGCKGGLEITVGRFVERFGIELASNYPYRKRADQCPYVQSTPEHRMGYLRVEEPRLLTIKASLIEAYLKLTPVLVGIAATPHFQEYGGGVDDALDCDHDRGHAMLIVGEGVVEGRGYWLFRNSYGKNWGEHGYYRLSKRSNCLLDGLAWVSEAHLMDRRLTKYNDQYESQPIEARQAEYSKLRFLWNAIESFQNKINP